MVNLRQIVNKSLSKKGIKSSGAQEGRLSNLQRKINDDCTDSAVAEVMSALESEFSHKLDRNDYTEIEKEILRELKKSY